MELNRLGEVYVGKHAPAYYQDCGVLFLPSALPIGGPHGVGHASGRAEVLGKGHVFQVYSEARAVGKMTFDDFRIKEKSPEGVKKFGFFSVFERPTTGAWEECESRPRPPPRPRPP